MIPLLLLATPWVRLDCHDKSACVSPPVTLMQFAPQAPNVRGWRPLPFPPEEARYGVDAFGYPRPRIVIGPGGDGWYPGSGESYRFLPTRNPP